MPHWLSSGSDKGIPNRGPNRDLGSIMVNAQVRLVLQRLTKKLPGCQGPTQSTQGGRTPLVPLPLWRSVQRSGYPAMGPVPSHPEVSYMDPARARQHPGKCERSTRLEEQRGGPEGGRPASHSPLPPLNLQLAWSVGGTRSCSVQSEKLVRCLFRFQNTWKW